MGHQVDKHTCTDALYTYQPRKGPNKVWVGHMWGHTGVPMFMHNHEKEVEQI